MKRLLFIYNMHAGKAKIRNRLAEIIDKFTAGGYEVTACPTQASLEAISKVSQMENGRYDLVVCSGGDGTLDEVVTGMMAREKENRVPIGYIPAGSTNDFARSLGLSSNMLTMTDRLLESNRFMCDIGKFNEDYFVYIAGFGMFTDVSYQTDQQMKNMLGHMAYLLEGMKRLTTIPSYHMKITMDDQVVEDDFIFGMITNSKSIGGFKSIIGKNVIMDDGVFEVTFIKKPQNIIDINEIATALVLAEMDEKHMISTRTSRIKIEAEENIEWTLDGEYGGSHKEVTISNLKKELEILI